MFVIPAIALALIVVLWGALGHVSAQGSGNVCFAEYTGGNVTDFSSADSQAVRAAVAAASAGGTVKIAGTCAVTVSAGGTTQLALIDKTLTLAGGYTTTNWLTSSPAQTTTLDALLDGRVISATAALTMQHLTIQNGRTTAIHMAGYGAGLYANQAIALKQVIFSNNAAIGAATFGGGAYVKRYGQHHRQRLPQQ
ncbi:hypothetical protein GC175_25975 [bacterium]|nr:hypothetical protein [bacterium]